MHLLGLSLKNSKIPRLFIRTNEGLKPNREDDLEYGDLRLKRGGDIQLEGGQEQINEEEFREAFKQMQESVAVNSAKHIINRAYTITGAYSRGLQDSIVDEEMEALRVIGKYSIQELCDIIEQYERRGEGGELVDRSV